MINKKHSLTIYIYQPDKVYKLICYLSQFLSYILRDHTQNIHFVRYFLDSYLLDNPYS